MYKKFFRLDYGDKNFCRLYMPDKNSANIPVIIFIVMVGQSLYRVVAEF